MNQELLDRFCQIVGSDNVKADEPMKLHTTFKIGGPADYFICPYSAQEVVKLITVCKQENIAYYIIGNGSNLLVGDKGYRGVIIQIYRNLNHMTINGNEINIEAGALLSTIAKKALEHGLTGFEFASGIPGTIGGAAVMNAGAYGGEMKDVLSSVTALTPEGEIVTIPKEELELGYRTSVIARKGFIVLSAVISLSPADKNKIKLTMEDLKVKRTIKQPLEYPSAGSTFKRPEGHFAGKLIMDSGLRGFKVGDAQVSEKHCGFVINRKQATANEVLELMDTVIKTVYDKFQVELEPEIKLLGEF